MPITSWRRCLSVGRINIFTLLQLFPLHGMAARFYLDSMLQVNVWYFYLKYICWTFIDIYHTAVWYMSIKVQQIRVKFSITLVCDRRRFKPDKDLTLYVVSTKYFFKIFLRFLIECFWFSKKSWRNFPLLFVVSG